jgi:LAS superfamily LD-carboxypeptidase LdcB
MINKLKKINLIYWINISIFIIIIGGIGCITWLGNNHLKSIDEKFSLVNSNIEFLEGKTASTTDQLQQGILQTYTELSLAINNEKENVGNIKDLLGIYQQEVGNISGTVSNLEKLTKIDPELLQKYSKVFFLNEHYSPARLTELPDNYEYLESKHSKISTEVWPYLDNMIKASTADGLELYVYSAYRSFDEQNALKNQYSIIYGSGTANQFSADQGYSEHQLGTTIDLITTGIGGTLEGFDKTITYKWLLGNAFKYGFIMSYPDNNEYYLFEPWHWRFVGVKLATKLHNEEKNFYDLDQREIDEYLIHLFE